MAGEAVDLGAQDVAATIETSIRVPVEGGDSGLKMFGMPDVIIVKNGNVVAAVFLPKQIPPVIQRGKRWILHEIDHRHVRKFIADSTRGFVAAVFGYKDLGDYVSCGLRLDRGQCLPKHVRTIGGSDDDGNSLHGR